MFQTSSFRLVLEDFMEFKKYILCAYCFIAGIVCKKCFIFEQCLEILCDFFVCLF